MGSLPPCTVAAIVHDFWGTPLPAPRTPGRAHHIMNMCRGNGFFQDWWSDFAIPVPMSLNRPSNSRKRLRGSPTQVMQQPASLSIAHAVASASLPHKRFPPSWKTPATGQTILPPFAPIRSITYSTVPKVFVQGLCSSANPISQKARCGL